MNLHIVRNTVRNDSRVLKEASALQSSGMFSSVEIVGLNEAGLPEEEVIAGLHVRRVTLASRGWSKGLPAQVMKLLEWRHRIIRTYANAPLTVIHCHDLDPLPIAVRLKALTGAQLVYDAHELETEQGETSKMRVALARAAERRLIGKADQMITVSASIAQWYRREYPGVAPALVRNIPLRPPSSGASTDLRRRYSVPADALLFIHVGALSPGRGVEQLLAAFSSPAVDHHLVFLGRGQLAPLVHSHAQACPRIHHLDAVPPSEVLGVAAGADAGVSMTLDTCLNNRYCLPNKLFECLLAGLPVLASDLPEQSAIVRTHDAGWCTATDPESIVTTLRSIDRASCVRIRQGLAARTAALDWKHEAEVLLGVYQKMLERSVPHYGIAAH